MIANPALIWAHLAAEALVVDSRARGDELQAITGLAAGDPLMVSDTSRSAGAVTQTIDDTAGTVTVTRT